MLPLETYFRHPDVEKVIYGRLFVENPYYFYTFFVAWGIYIVSHFASKFIPIYNKLSPGIQAEWCSRYVKLAFRNSKLVLRDAGYNRFFIVFSIMVFFFFFELFFFSFSVCRIVSTVHAIVISYGALKVIASNSTTHGRKEVEGGEWSVGKH